MSTEQLRTRLWPTAANPSVMVVIPQTRWTGEIILHLGRWRNQTSAEWLRGASLTIIHMPQPGRENGFWSGIWTGRGRFCTQMWGLA